MWVDPEDPAVYSYITTGVADPEATVGTDLAVQLVLSSAEQVLAGLTSGRVHPAGTATEDFRATPFVHRLSVGKRPLLTVESIVVVEADEDPVDISTVTVSGSNIYFPAVLQRFLPSSCRGLAGFTTRVEYTFGSTLTAAAKQALLDFARQLFLALNQDDDCQLPERVTNINREGVSYSIIDPQTFLDKDQVGLSRVDLWISSVNPSKSRRYAGVYTPDSPIGTNRRILL